MPHRWNKGANYGEKLIRLFANLLFARRPHSLTELAGMLNCSKQTVARIVRDIESSYQVVIERHQRGKEALYSISSRTSAPPAAFLSNEEMELLWMCRAFSERLLGRTLFQEVSEALVKSQPLVKGDSGPSIDCFGTLVSGTIDYTPHQRVIQNLLESIRDKSLCRATYRTAGGQRAKTFHIKPLKIFSYKDTLYLHALRAKDPWETRYVAPAFDPVLAIHRFKKVEKADRTIPFEVPKAYDFEKAFNKTFGIIKERTFQVEAEFTGWAAVYIEERLWSPDQEIVRHGEKVTIRFSASSEPEVLTWILSFGDKARLLKPSLLVRETETVIQRMRLNYTRGRDHVSGVE